MSRVKAVDAIACECPLINTLCFFCLFFRISSDKSTTSTPCRLRIANLRMTNQNILPATRSTNTKTILDTIIPIITSSLHTSIATSNIKQPAAVTLFVEIHVSHAAHARELEIRRARGGEAVDGGVCPPGGSRRGRPRACRSQV